MFETKEGSVVQCYELGVGRGSQGQADHMYSDPREPCPSL